MKTLIGRLVCPSFHDLIMFLFNLEQLFDTFKISLHIIKSNKPILSKKKVCVEHYDLIKTYLKGNSFSFSFSLGSITPGGCK